SAGSGWVNSQQNKTHYITGYNLGPSGFKISPRLSLLVRVLYQRYQITTYGVVATVMVVLCVLKGLPDALMEQLCQPSAHQRSVISALTPYPSPTQKTPLK
ncbi:MAG: hypothetical protein PF503_08355, partial [Desulfobacula sp.]|nr:hypothetical protein [Desulfobacula sp.]